MAEFSFGVRYFFGVLQGVVFAETVAPNIVAHYTFDEGTDGWWLYGNGSARLGRERVTPDSSDYCLVAYDRPDTWTSPAINIYQLIRAYGPGTYTVHATVKVDSASGHKTRILMRSNKENSFIKKQYDNYHMWLSEGPSLKKNEWSKLSGSFKILPSDISASTGDLQLCFDSLVEEGERVALFINDVIICKLSTTGATNGTFEYGTVGWRNWGGYGTFDVSTQYKFGNFVPIGHYLKASIYGSIACNVDQILANYGRIKYQIDFDLYLPSYSLEAVDKLSFYLSRGDYRYHYLIEQRDNSQLVHGWQHISLEFDTSKVPYNIGSDILHDLLEPNTREVFFRIQYDPVEDAPEKDEEYGITDFTFRPKSEANYVPSQSLRLSDTTLELVPGQSYQLTATLLPSNATYKGIQWKTTNGYYVGVNQYGLITAHGKPGTSAVITAQSEDGVCIARCTVVVLDIHGKYLRDDFGFDLRTINIISRIYQKINNIYPGNQWQKDYMFARILGGFRYLDGKWETGAGKIYEGTTEQAYIIEQLEIPLEDYKYVRYHVRLQNAISSDPIRWHLNAMKQKKAEGNPQDYNDCLTNYRNGAGINATEQEFESAWIDIYNRYYNKGDFAHQMYVTAALLWGGNGTIDEERKDLAGWLGDATLVDEIGNVPTLNADDYYADLDAENIVYIMKQTGYGYKRSFEKYYNEAGNLYTRAEKFLEHTSLTEVGDQICFKLYETYMPWESLVLSAKTAAAMNFIKNLKNKNHEFQQYYER